MVEGFEKEAKRLVDIARAHIFSAHSLANEISEHDDPPGQCFSIMELNLAAADRLDDLARLIGDACPKPGELASGYETGFTDALRSIEHALKAPKADSMGQAMGVLLGKTLAKLKAHYAETPAAEASATDAARPAA